MAAQKKSHASSSLSAPLSIARGWTHLIIGCSLSPRAKKSLLTALHSLGLEGLSALSAEQLFIPLLDLGLCHRSNAFSLEVMLEQIAPRHCAFKLSTGELSQAALSAPVAQADRLVTLKLRDRFDQLHSLRQELSGEAQRRGFVLSSQSHPSGVAHRRTPSPELLMGVSSDERARLSLDHRSPIWVNDLILLSRPHDYLPQRGYHIERAVRLPTEPPISQLEPDGATSEARDQARIETLQQRLDERLEARAQAYRVHDTNRASEPTAPRPKRRRRRRKAKQD